MFFKKRQAQSSSQQNTLDRSYDESHLELMLDQVMKFIDAFKKILPGEWYFFDLYVEAARKTYGSSLYTETGLVVFKITVGNWWDGLLRQFPDVEDYMLSVFEFNPQERTFIATIKAGECENRMFPTSAVVGMLQQSLNNYETKHPEVQFQRQNWGARIGNV